MPREQRFLAEAAWERFPHPRNGGDGASFLNRMGSVSAIQLLPKPQGQGTGETSALQKPQQLWRVKQLVPAENYSDKPFLLI